MKRGFGGKLTTFTIFLQIFFLVLLGLQKHYSIRGFKGLKGCFFWGGGGVDYFYHILTDIVFLAF